MADAEAIVIAAQRPEMRFVEPKCEDQQARAVLFRARERLVHQHTELVNALHAVLYEFGHAVPKGIGNIKRIDAKTKTAKEAAATADTARRLQTMPGVGPLTALANKMARGIWALLTKNEGYRDPAQAVAAQSTCAAAT